MIQTKYKIAFAMLCSGVGFCCGAVEPYWLIYQDYGVDRIDRSRHYSSLAEACTIFTQLYADVPLSYTPFVNGPDSGGCEDDRYPASYMNVNLQRYCAPGINASDVRCIPVPIDPAPPSCGAAAGNPLIGNPISLVSTAKIESVKSDLGRRLGGWSLRYDSGRVVALNTGLASGAFGKYADLEALGDLWFSSLHRRARIYNGDHALTFSSGNARVSTYMLDAQGQRNPVSYTRSRIVYTSNSVLNYNEDDLVLDEYDRNSGLLLRSSSAAGKAITYLYSDGSTPAAIAPTPGLLISATNQLGGAISFTYVNSPLGVRLATATEAGVGTESLAYDAAGNLSSITWADGAIRKFLYELPSASWALTGIVDEKNVRKSTFGYDGAGRAVSTQSTGVGGAYSISYSTLPYYSYREWWDSYLELYFYTYDWVSGTGGRLTKPDGSVVNFTANAVVGTPRITSQTQPAGSGCAASSSSNVFDAVGNLTSSDDFNGHRTCYGYDTTTKFELSRVEGLAGGASGVACTGVLTANAVLPAGSRKVTQSWHPDWRVPTKVAEPGRITTYVYNGQPDPFNGNNAASCAPGAATLPDGKPIVVLCKKVEQATSDANGASAFSAALQAGVPNRVWQWTYDQNGQVLTETDPLGGTTTNTYYSDTTVDHTIGDLSQVSNALGQVTQFTKYNKAGLVLQSQDPNGVLTVNTYDARQRLTSQSVGGQATTYTWDAAGLLTKVTQPNGAILNYGYDAAQRLTSVSDGLGNKITYTLDAMGNRTADKVTDPMGILKAQVTRVIDALGRVQQTTGRE